MDRKPNAKKGKAITVLSDEDFALVGGAIRIQPDTRVPLGCYRDPSSGEITCMA